MCVCVFVVSIILGWSDLNNTITYVAEVMI